MKIIIAPDSFKGSLSAAKAANIIARQFQTVFPEAEIIELPLADGGEGTLDIVHTPLGARLISKKVKGPLGEPVSARFGLVEAKKTAIIESAAACGMGLVPPESLNPLRASSYGLGELILAALNHGAREIIVTLGGSATVDGGLGMANALGYRLTDALGRVIPDGGAGLLGLSHIDPSGRDPRLPNCYFRIAADVNNPLFGLDGAASVFGPQKGATPDMVSKLDRGLINMMQVFNQHKMLYGESPGDGAAGGLGAGLRAFCGGKIESAAEWVCQTVGLDALLEDATLLITGEGQSDQQTLQGKLCHVVCKHARRKNVPVLLLSGSIANPKEILAITDFAVSISSGERSLAEMILNSEHNLAHSALTCARLFFTQL